MLQHDTDAHWRDSALTPKFFVVDARAAFAILILLLRPHWYTLAFAIVFIAFLAFLDYVGLSITVTFRVARGWLSGPKKMLVRRL